MIKLKNLVKIRVKIIFLFVFLFLQVNAYSEYIAPNKNNCKHAKSVKL